MNLPSHSEHIHVFYYSPGSVATFSCLPQRVLRVTCDAKWGSCLFRYKLPRQHSKPCPMGYRIQ